MARFALYAGARRRIRALPWTSATAAYIVAYIGYDAWIHRRAAAVQSDAGGWISNLACALPAVLAALLFGLASRRISVNVRMRRGLRLMAIQSAFVALAWWFMALAAHGGALISYGRNGIDLLRYALLLSALFSLQARPHVAVEWWKFALDTATVLLCSAVAIWYFGLNQESAFHAYGARTAVAVASPLAGLVILLGITTIMLRAPRQFPYPFEWLVTSQVLCIASDLLASVHLVAPTSIGPVDGTWVLALAGSGYVFLIASAEGYRRGLAPDEIVAQTGADLDGHPASPLPYIASGAILFLMWFMAFRSWPAPLSVLILATAPVPLLLAARQLIAVRQNVQFLTERAERAAETRLRAQLQDQLLHSQRLEAVGQLAGGVAHDFNNIMTAISTNAELALAALPADSAAREDLAEIRVAVGRATSLTRQLLAFSRRQVLHPRVLDLNAVVTGCERMLARLIGEQLQIERALAPMLPPILADPGQLEQVLVNLVVNARDAMPTGGWITVDTAPVTIDARQAATLPAMQPGSYVRLAVRDTGVGMDPTVAARVFEPFFTTKPHGKGTGLGLSTVYGIVKQSGGYVYVDTAPQRGTTFNVYFPVTRATASNSTRGPEPITPLVRRGAETILVVEDEPGVRATIARALRHQGYRVLEATDGVHGLAISAGHSGPIHLVVSDVVMPHLTGPAMLERLRRHRPNAKALLISGYAAPHIREAVDEADIAVLEKPFVLTTLVRRVREVLDQPAQEPAPEDQNRSSAESLATGE